MDGLPNRTITYPKMLQSDIASCNARRSRTRRARVITELASMLVCPFKASEKQKKNEPSIIQIVQQRDDPPKQILLPVFSIQFYIQCLRHCSNSAALFRINKCRINRPNKAAALISLQAQRRN
ncbi:hypothetical protein EVAR_54485_1 [Eumeta japonica]|uniref:Uncharacterized protein n=1 Tax=Eumeta variegata TaxID=151549 RepID=A0A4C1YXQ4_EUMVA|nr:hypothetical protein EVAR_54485_1 [Eumeta japonica]